MGPGMARTWRSGAGLLLALYLILDVIAVICAAVAHPALSQKAEAPWLPIAAFLTWRVSRGSRASRVILIILSALSFAGAMFIRAPSWNLSVLGLLAIYATQIALLVSPAVYQRIRLKRLPDPGAMASMPVKPPLWMLLSALLAGLVVTLLFLGSMDVAAIPGCGPAGATMAQLPSRCLGLAQGYPLRFLTAYQGTPKINKAALVMDWAQWSLVIFSTLYLLRLPGCRPGPLRDQPSVAKEPSAV
jgi:hypothetical protein